MGKEPACNTGDARYMDSIPGLGRSPGGGHSSPLLYACMDHLHGERSLVVDSPWGHEESDMTE